MGENSLTNESKKQISDKANKVRILHLTDVHYDSSYKPGSIANCNELLCCRAKSKNGTKRAGFWGSYGEKCDVPLHLIENLFHHINTSHGQDYDVIYWTGDNSEHAPWMMSTENTMNATETITDLMKKYLGSNKIVIPIIGNHETAPPDL